MMQVKRRIVRAGLLLLPVLSTSIVLTDLFQTITPVDEKGVSEARASAGTDIPLPEPTSTELPLRQGTLFPGDAVEENKGITSLDHENDETEEGSGVPVATHFKDNEDGTVTDRRTALMWTRDANLIGDTVTLHQSLDFVEGMNKGNNKNFGYTNWRLPNLSELQNLIDYTKYHKGGHALPSGHPFHNVQSLRFNDRSHATYLTASPYRWFIFSYCSIFGRNSRYCYGYLWPVRSVQERATSPDTD